MTDVMSPDALERALRKIGEERYHNLHPFHKMLHGGRMNFGQVQAWALNRYVYQAAIPRKDAALMARLEDRALRREWIHRIHDHDGLAADSGGIERWLKLTDGLKLGRAYVISQEGALPATKFAVEGLSEAMAKELEPLGVKVLIVEPGPFRTDWAGRSLKTPKKAIDAYAETAVARRKATAAYSGSQAGDPVRGAHAIIQAVESGTPPLRLVLGSVAQDVIAARTEAFRAELLTGKEVAHSCDFPREDAPAA